MNVISPQSRDSLFALLAATDLEPSEFFTGSSHAPHRTVQDGCGRGIQFAGKRVSGIRPLVNLGTKE